MTRSMQCWHTETSSQSILWNDSCGGFDCGGSMSLCPFLQSQMGFLFLRCKIIFCTAHTTALRPA